MWDSTIKHPLPRQRGGGFLITQVDFYCNEASNAGFDAGGLNVSPAQGNSASGLRFIFLLSAATGLAAPTAESPSLRDPLPSTSINRYILGLPSLKTHVLM